MLYFPKKTIDKALTASWSQTFERNKLLGYEFHKSNTNKMIVLFHGNGGNAQSRTFYADLAPPDVNVFLAEYPGYGQNADDPISMEAILEQSRSVMRTIIQTRRLEKNFDYKNSIVVVGESLGTGVASQMAQEFGINRLLLITPYDSILHAAQVKLPWLWCKPVLRNNYDNIKNLQNYQGKVFLVISEKDEVLPPLLADNLFNHLKNENKEKIIIKNAHHNDWYDNLTVEDRLKINHFIE